ncbi:UNVERIFIED_CONTAM: hypothetical protein Sradi_3197700 [Sesamum radiatum]|uniref:Uncharacterized protein n=1 Tax=Sesamum radiatum TaxID=300843 RepID=A0AAW2RFD0_SESRA
MVFRSAGAGASGLSSAHARYRGDGKSAAILVVVCVAGSAPENFPATGQWRRNGVVVAVLVAGVLQRRLRCG